MSTYLPPIAIAVIIAIIVAIALHLSAERLRARSVATLQAINAVMEPYRRGDYEAALLGAESFRRGGQVTASYCFYRGSSLAHLGRLEEAEVWLRRNIVMRDGESLRGEDATWSKAKKKRYLAIAYSSLAHLMLQAGRFDEARECFETSIRHVPDRGSAYRGMAVLCLMRRDSPAEALRWIKLGIERDQTDPTLSPQVRKLSLGEGIAVLAWATAAESRSASDVALWVTEAIKIVGNSDIGSTAQVHYHSGCAWAELGDLQASALQYQEAFRLDPQGESGRAARAALRSAGQSDNPEGEA
jgi:tetratricopeptide (TPR) repeat protein